MSPEERIALDTIAAWLARDDAPLPDRLDAVVVMGSQVIETAETAAHLVSNGQAKWLVIAGGIGHATQLLRGNLLLHSKYGVAPEHESEAELLARVALAHGVSQQALLLDTTSTNAGENVREAKKLLLPVVGDRPKLAILQDPTMQRRAHATFEHQWPEAQLWSQSVWVPTMGARPDVWTDERLAELIVGEVPRLRNDANGYGPLGKGFIAAVEVPTDVEAAYAILKAQDPNRDRLA